jgi:hypothetical protein
MTATAVRAHLVVGGDFHDMDFARLQLLQLLAEHEHVRTTVSSDYTAIASIDAADCLLTYTCNVRPNDDEVASLERLMSRPRARWFALHGTNAALDLGRPVRAPRVFPRYARLLGTQFVAHPPIEPYTVTVSRGAEDHWLTKGIESFETTDELYLCEHHDDVTPLLETRWSGTATGFEEDDWPDDQPRLVAYHRQHTVGEVLYLTLGHCRGHYDMQPHTDWWPTVDRGSWNLPVFVELVQRGIDWMIGGQP